MKNYGCHEEKGLRTERQNEKWVRNFKIKAV